MPDREQPWLRELSWTRAVGRSHRRPGNGTARRARTPNYYHCYLFASIRPFRPGSESPALSSPGLAHLRLHPPTALGRIMGHSPPVHLRWLENEAPDMVHHHPLSASLLFCPSMVFIFEIAPSCNAALYYPINPVIRVLTHYGIWEFCVEHQILYY